MHSRLGGSAVFVVVVADDVIVLAVKVMWIVPIVVLILVLFLLLLGGSEGSPSLAQRWASTGRNRSSTNNINIRRMIHGVSIERLFLSREFSVVTKAVENSVLGLFFFMIFMCYNNAGELRWKIVVPVRMIRNYS